MSVKLTICFQVVQTFFPDRNIGVPDEAYLLKSLKSSVSQSGLLFVLNPQLVLISLPLDPSCKETGSGDTHVERDSGSAFCGPSGVP